jgi:Galactose oxidase, central domain
MKHSFFIITITLLFAACKKQELVAPVTDQQKEPITNNIPSPTPSYFWKQVSTGFPNQFPYTNFNGRTLVMKVDDEVYLLAGDLLETTFLFNTSSRKFERVTPPNPSASWYIKFAVGHQYLFSYGPKIYGGFRDYESDTSYFFSIDPLTGTVQPLARYPGIYDGNVISFLLGNKGYVVSGYTASLSSKVWEYDFAANTWTNIGNSPLGKRKGGIALVLNNKVYMGLGYELTNFNGQTIRVYKKDWIEYTPGASYHAVKANFPGTGRTAAQGFIMNNNIYLGFGQNSNTQTRDKDLWRYSSSSNTWTQQADWPGVYGDDDAWYGGNSDNVGIFSVGSTGYLVKGGLNQFWHFTNSPFVIQ